VSNKSLASVLSPDRNFIAPDIGQIKHYDAELKLKPDITLFEVGRLYMGKEMRYLGKN